MKPLMDTEKVIDAIRRRPVLYNKSDANYYTHKKHKSKIWTDICKEVFTDWDQFRPQDKVEYRHELQKRWKSLRTCFTRELALQKKERAQYEKDGKAVKRRKRYEYFECLTFLLNPDAITDAEMPNEDEDSSDPLDMVKTESMFDDRSNPASDCSRMIVEPNDLASAHMPYYERNGNVTEEKIIEIIRELKKDEEDEDRQFMLSLVPSFRKLKDKQKFEARIQILKVLKDVTFQENES